MSNHTALLDANAMYPAPVCDTKLERTRDLMDTATRDALVKGHESDPFTGFTRQE